MVMGALRRAGTNLMNGANQIGGWYPDSTAAALQTRIASSSRTPSTPAELYALLRHYYANNSLYDQLARGLYDMGIANPAQKGLRNPAFSVVEFYVASVIPGSLEEALPIEDAASDAVATAIRQVWTWSNWGTQKQVFVRWLAMLGDVFVKVVQTPDRSRVYFQLTDPAYVVDFDTDERGFVTYCRIDTPVQRRRGDRAVPMTHTEVWSLAEQTMRRWEHDQGQTPTEELGAPLETVPLEAFGIDFVPIVPCQFRDVGEQRGVGAYTLQLDAINELATICTKLHREIYRSNANTWVAESAGTGPDGRPLAALRVGEQNIITLADEAIFSLPGGYTLKSLVPEIDFTASLAVLESFERNLQKALPEMGYYDIAEMGTGDVSGRALRYKMTAAVARAIEVRGNVHEALQRAAAMALTMGAAARLPGFAFGGTYESGAFEHRYGGQDVIPLSDLEQYQADVQQATAAKLRLDLGVTKAQVQAELGYDEQLIATMAQQKEAEQADLAEAMGGLLNRQPGATVPANGPPRSAE